MSSIPTPGPNDSNGADDPNGPSRLDPSDPAAFRRLAHEVLDACLDRLERVRELPWTPAAGSVPGADALPRDGVPLERVADELVRRIMPGATGNTHPRFFGWVHGTGLASGLLAEMVAATMNSNCGGRSHVAIDVERTVIDWCARVHGLPDTAGGVLCGGTSAATLVALHAARVRRFGRASRRAPGEAFANATCYAAEGTHQCVGGALELMGLGSESLRKLPIDPATGSLSLEALGEALAADRAAGLSPLCLVGTAGSVNTGRFDDLEALADAARRESLWLHVDGAFGAWVALADAPWRDLARGIARADSLAFDFHKWPYVQYAAAAVLVRERDALGEAFGGDAAYLESEEAGLAAGSPWPCDLGPELSREFRALKIWTALRTHGLDALGASITDNCAQAAALGARVTASEELELAAPVISNVCCFRLSTDLVAGDAADALHRAIATALQLSGECVLSTTRVDGAVVLRAAIVNHRTTLDDVRLTVEAVRREARERTRTDAPSLTRTMT